MEKPVAAIEFGSKKLKLVVGYELKGQVYVLYALTKPYGHAIEAGSFVEPEKVVGSVKDIKDIVDASVKLKLTISEALLSLPPYGLEIFQNSQIVTVMSEENRIANFDIRNLYALIRNGASGLSEQLSLVNIVPEQFILDRGRSFVRPPIGESSRTLTVSAKVHMMPGKIIKDYSNVLTTGGIELKRGFVAPHAAADLIATDPNMPKDYFLVDIGSNITTVSLVGGSCLFSSRYFEWGGDRITEKIIENFNINEADAEKYKIMYGIDKREMNFKAPVCKVDDGQGNVVKHYTDELNAIIKSELDIFLKDLNATIDTILKTYDYDSTYRNMPMILVGGGSRLFGLIEYITPKVQSDTVLAYYPKSLGARNATFTNCLGMILANSKTPNVYDESHPRVGQLTREEKK